MGKGKGEGKRRKYCTIEGEIKTIMCNRIKGVHDTILVCSMHESRTKAGEENETAHDRI